MQGKKLRVRVGVIAVHEGKILLARQHLAQRQDFWIVPGGGLKKGEGLLDCARREMAEETGLQIEPIQLLYVGDFFKGDRHVVDTFWLARIVGGELRRREDEIDNIHFFDISQLNEIEIRPPSLAEHVLTGFREGFRSAAVYLGKYTKDNRSPEPTVGES